MSDLMDQEVRLENVVKYTMTLIAAFVFVLGCFWNLQSRLTIIDDNQKNTKDAIKRIEDNQEAQRREMQHMEEYMKIPPLGKPQAYNNPEPDISKRLSPPSPRQTFAME
jgi:hypothetical protein